MRYLSLFTLVVFAFCNPPKDQNSGKPDYYGHLSDSTVRQILKKAIDKTGGIEAWRNLRSIRYTKRSKLYAEDGTVERDYVQRHVYTMQPAFAAKISWAEGQDKHLVAYAPPQAQKFINDTLVAEDPTQAVMGALYVLGMPFKLLDQGTTLNYGGRVALPSGAMADVVRATYDPAAHGNHSTQDVWYYYFGADDGAFHGALVHHPPTYAYIENLAFDHTSAIQFHKHRKSYRSDSSRNIKFLRAEFWYTDYRIE